jgi:hypothetical protein
MTTIRTWHPPVRPPKKLAKHIRNFAAVRGVFSLVRRVSQMVRVARVSPFFGLIRLTF